MGRGKMPGQREEEDVVNKCGLSRNFFDSCVSAKSGKKMEQKKITLFFSSKFKEMNVCKNMHYEPHFMLLNSEFIWLLWLAWFSCNNSLKITLIF